MLQLGRLHIEVIRLCYILPKSGQWGDGLRSGNKRKTGLNIKDANIKTRNIRLKCESYETRKSAKQKGIGAEKTGAQN